jgi:hypothetical protein
MRLVASRTIIGHSVCLLFVASAILVDVIKLAWSLLQIWDYRVIIEGRHMDGASLA